MRFVQIAGNEQVAITAVVPQTAGFEMPGSELLFSMGLLTAPGTQRVELRAPVASLHTVLNAFADRGLKVEHVYDF